MACGKITQPRTKTSDERAFGWLSVKNSVDSRQEFISQGLAQGLLSDGVGLWSWQAETADGVLRPGSYAARQRAGSRHKSRRMATWRNATSHCLSLGGTIIQAHSSSRSIGFWKSPWPSSQAACRWYYLSTPPKRSPP